MKRYIPYTPGLYDFISPNVQDLLPHCVELNIVVSTFTALVSAWGSSYLSPTLLVWTQWECDRYLITPCVIEMDDGSSEPVLVFGPFRDRVAREHFKQNFTIEFLPFYHDDDTATVMIKDKR
jgi:hypothetical protein